MDNILSIRNVTKNYTGHRALDDISIEIPRGSIYGLLGPNGAGKTTLIRIINHITAPDSGEVMFDGRPLTADDVVNIGYLPEERGLYKKMKVGEQAIFFARLKGLSRSQATQSLRQWFERLDIADWWNRRVDELSKGMAQKVQFIVTVLHRPRLLIFDEPFSGFDPINANILKNEILALRDEGSTIIFSTHNMSSVEEICDDITLINNGHNILSGNVADLRHRFVDGRHVLTFDGDPVTLMEKLQPLAGEFAVDEKAAGDGLHTLSLKQKPGADMRSVIAAANDTVLINSIAPAIASMNDIFIKAVSSSNKNNDSAL